MKGVTGSNGDGNSKTRHFTKIVSFFINNIINHCYFIQFTIEMMKLINNLMKKFLRFEKTRIIMTAIPTLNV